MKLTSRSTAVFFASGCLLVFALYLQTISPGLFWRDTAEFAMIPFNVDIGHPAGSPTFTMIAGIFSRLPIGSIAFRSNFITALIAAFSLWTMAWAAKTIASKAFKEIPAGLAWAIGAAAVAPILFSSGYWYWATAAEVYSAQIAILSVIIALALQTGTGRESRDLRPLLSIALLLGLSCGLHMVMILYAPAFGIYLFLTSKKDFRIADIIAFAAAFFLGFSVFALLPIRSAANPPFDYGNPEDFQAFIAHITGRKYSDILQSYPWQRIMENMGYLAGHLVGQLSPLHALGAIFGLWLLLKKQWHVALFLCLICIGHLYLYIRDWKIDFGYLTIYLIAALAAAFAGAVLAQHLLAKKPGRATAMTAAFVLVAIGGAAGQWAMNKTYCDKSGNDLLYRQTRAVLNSMPPDSVLVSFEDAINYASVYTQSIDRWREDVIHFHRAYLALPEYLSARFPDLNTSALDGSEFSIQRFLDANANRHPPFWNYGWELPGMVKIENLAPYGHIMRVLNEPVKDLDATKVLDQKIWNETMAPIVADFPPSRSDWTAYEVTARFFSMRAQYYYAMGRLDLSQNALKQALELKPESAPYYVQLAAVFSALGQNDKALPALETAAKLDPYLDFAWSSLGSLYQSKGELDGALDAYSRSLSINKAQPEIAFRTASIWYRKEKFDRAQTVAKMGLKYTQKPEERYSLNEMLAMSLIRLQKCPKAIPVLEEMNRIRPQDEKAGKMMEFCKSRGIAP